MKIIITAEAIAQGNRHEHAALMPGGAHGASDRARGRVMVAGVRIHRDKAPLEIPLPDAARAWLRKYDARQPVPPLEFELEFEP